MMDMKTYGTFAIVAVVAAMLVASAAVAIDDAFAGKKEKKRVEPSNIPSKCLW